MKICYTSARYFPDGPVTTLLDESDPANIAYALQGDYFSFYTLKTLSPRALQAKLRPYDYVFVALDAEAPELVRLITEVCAGRAVTYSEGHINDYQRLSPAAQVDFVQATRLAAANFLFWKKYVPFYRTLTQRPVDYLPIPYQVDAARRHFRPLAQRARRVVLPSGLQGATRNGLVNVLVARELLARQLVDEVVIFLEKASFDEDLQASTQLLFDEPLIRPTAAPHRADWRTWLAQSGMDYRALLQIKHRFFPAPARPASAQAVKVRQAVFYPRQSFTHYLNLLGAARLMIDMNNRETVGRTAADCAVLELPCVSTRRSDLHEQLFPDTVLADSWDIAGAVELGQRLLQDPGFYARTTATAAAAVPELDLATLRPRLAQLFIRHQLPFDQ